MFAARDSSGVKRLFKVKTKTLITERKKQLLDTQSIFGVLNAAKARGPITDRRKRKT
jgi:hypothetical protein